jgi:hypothetical protein
MAAAVNLDMAFPGASLRVMVGDSLRLRGVHRNAGERRAGRPVATGTLYRMQFLAIFRRIEVSAGYLSLWPGFPPAPV